MRRAAGILLVLVFACTQRAYAEGEFGIGFGGAAIVPPFVADDRSGAALWSVHIGGRIGPAFHLEGVFDKMRGCPEVCAVYAIQVKQDLSTLRDGTGVFVTYGLAGPYISERSYESHYRSSDGQEYVERRAAHDHLYPPVIPVGGVGLERKLFGRVSLRIDVQGYAVFVLPVGVRASAGLAVPFAR